ncbi:hypothetical protein NCLIV_011170 [Neospora caninum Liverpool]|uniref:Pumilio-family RNA binding repeat-containing protein n=1 Tax=Neospora caninum (strain Liverpool) TaxID=572307 RepID=F0VAG1_NEOCL|nr:hypothetical protein NCLIV_011170 [Neospora caninum Liverpool]CBZ50650.1 hypothetical protein NCLIV_011170 [Neospora caninum Liverpool]CEL65262.1 TPA: Pumilio-family RNA binding repeat-containing protein [Neospora caninum Liverpool]|eukprot:XP_003880683.1 hypothetical protein NCLIV_011170 [Neospora caninum Liverpool]
MENEESAVVGLSAERATGVCGYVETKSGTVEVPSFFPPDACGNRFVDGADVCSEVCLSPVKARPVVSVGNREEEGGCPVKGHRDSTASASTQASQGDGRRSSGRLDDAVLFRALSSLSTFTSFDSQRRRFSAEGRQSSHLLAQIEEDQEEDEGGPRQVSGESKASSEKRETPEEEPAEECQSLSQQGKSPTPASPLSRGPSSSSLPVPQGDLVRDVNAREPGAPLEASALPLCSEKETKAQTGPEREWEEPSLPVVSFPQRDASEPRPTPFSFGLGSRDVHPLSAYSSSFSSPSSLFPSSRPSRGAGVPAEVERAFSIDWLQGDKGPCLSQAGENVSSPEADASLGLDSIDGTRQSQRALGHSFAGLSGLAPPPGMTREGSHETGDMQAQSSSRGEQDGEAKQGFSEDRKEEAQSGDVFTRPGDADGRGAGQAEKELDVRRPVDNGEVLGDMSPRARARQALDSIVRPQASSPAQPHSPGSVLFDGLPSHRDGEVRLHKALSFLRQSLGLGKKESAVLLDVLVALGMEREERDPQESEMCAEAGRVDGVHKEKGEDGRGNAGKDSGQDKRAGPHRKRGDETLEALSEGRPEKDGFGQASRQGTMSLSTHSPSPPSSSPMVSSPPCHPPVAFPSPPPLFSSPSSPGLTFLVPQQPPGLGAERERRDTASGRGASPACSLVSLFPCSSPSSPSSSAAPSFPQPTLHPSPFPGSPPSSCWHPVALPTSRLDVQRDTVSPSSFFISEEELSLLEHIVATERQKRETNAHSQAGPQLDPSLLERLLLLRDKPYMRHTVPLHAGVECGVPPVPEVQACGADTKARAPGPEGCAGTYPDAALVAPGEFERKRLLYPVTPHDFTLASPHVLPPPFSSPSSSSCCPISQRSPGDLAGAVSSALYPRHSSSHAAQGNDAGLGNEAESKSGRGGGKAKAETHRGLAVRSGAACGGVPGGAFFPGPALPSLSSPLDFLSPEAAPQPRPGGRATRSPVSSLASASPSAIGTGSATDSVAESRRGRKKRENRRGRGSGPASAVEGMGAANAPLPPSCSTALRNFRLGTVSPFTMRDIGDNALEFAKDPFASAFLQEQLEVCSLADRVPVLLQLLPHVLDLSADQHGNYVLQKFFEKGTDKEKEWLAAQLTGHVFRLSLEVYGCRLIQRAVESLPVPAQLRLVAELKDHVVTCVEDQHGNHVIQKCAERLPSPSAQFIIDAFKGQEARMSVHSYGCRVIQRLLEACPISQVATLIDAVMAELRMLIRDQFGNYVVQHILEFGRDSDKMKIIDFMCEDIIPLSTEKYACNVVERALTLNAMGCARRGIISAALGPEMMGQPLKMVMLDRYGNYVVQRMMEVAPDDLRPPLLRLLREHVDILKKFTYGKHIVTALERLESSGGSGSSSGPASPPSLGYSTGGSPKGGKGGREVLSRTVSAPLSLSADPPAQLHPSSSFSASTIPRPRSVHPPPPRTEAPGRQSGCGPAPGSSVLSVAGEPRLSSSLSASPVSVPQPPAVSPPPVSLAPRVLGGGSCTPRGEGLPGKGRDRGQGREGQHVSFSASGVSRDQPDKRFGSRQAKPLKGEKGRAQRGEKSRDRTRQEKSDEAGKSVPSRSDEGRGKSGPGRMGEGGDAVSKGKRKGDRADDGLGYSRGQPERRAAGSAAADKGGRRRECGAEKTQRSHAFVSGADEALGTSGEEVPNAKGRGGRGGGSAAREEESPDLQQWVSGGQAFSRQASALAALQRYFLASLSSPVRSQPRAPSAQSGVSQAAAASSVPSFPAVRAEVQRASTFGSLSGNAVWDSSSSEPPSTLPSFSVFTPSASGSHFARHCPTPPGRPSVPAARGPCPGVPSSPEAPSVLSEVMDIGAGSVGAGAFAWPRRERAMSDCVPSSFSSCGRVGPLPPLPSVARDTCFPLSVRRTGERRDERLAAVDERRRQPGPPLSRAPDAGAHASTSQSELVACLHPREASGKQASGLGESAGRRPDPAGRPPMLDEEGRNTGNVLPLTPEMMNEVLKAFQQYRHQT